jgi:hypothetical protein
MRKRVIVYFIILIIIKFTFAELKITEIMYNPIGSDYDLEWIEIYNNGTKIDLTNWKIDNYNFQDNNMSKNEYLIIARELIDQDQDNLSFEAYYGNNDCIWNLTDGNYSCLDGYFSLSNDKDIINLSNKTISILVYYNSSLGANGDGNSLQLINNSWFSSYPTPGKKNNLTIETQNIVDEDNNQDLKLEINLEDVLNINVNYDNLFKITNLAHISGTTDNIHTYVYYNISRNNSVLKQDIFNVTINYYTTADTGNYIFNKTGNYLICGKILNSSINDTNKENDVDCKNITIIDTSNIPCNVSLSIETDNLIYNNSEKIKFYNELNNESYIFKITYWITDIFGNEIKKAYTTDNTNQKSYTPNIDETDQVLIIKSNLSFVACNDSNLEDNYDEKLFIVKASKELDSKIDIIKIYLGSDEKVEFGDFVRVKILVYKGNTSKNSIKAWIEEDNEKISYITYSNVYSKFNEIEITIPIRIKPNCNKKYDYGNYDLIVSGLDTNDTENIYIKGITESICKKSSSSESSLTLTEKDEIEYEILDFKNEYFIDEIIEAKLKINNLDQEDHEYTVWSYVYRGPKCYSGKREDNQKKFIIKAGNSKTIKLENIPKSVNDGEYKYKIKIKKDQQKTEHELTEDIFFKEKIESDKVSVDVEEPFIKTFYTLSKKYSDNINLYANIENYHNNLSLILDSFDDTKIINEINKKNKINVELHQGKNVFILKLFQEKDVLDMKELIVFGNQTDILQYQNSVDYLNEMPKLKTEKELKNNNLITGNAVNKEYISSGEKSKLIIPFLIAGIIGCVVFILIKNKLK